MFRTRVNYQQLLSEYGFNNAQILQLIELGELVPEDWKNMGETRRSQAIRDRSITFHQADVNLLIRKITSQYLRNYFILERLELVINVCQSTLTEVINLKDRQELTNEPMDLKEMAARLGGPEKGYKAQTLLNYIRRHIKKHDMPSDSTVARLEMPGMSVPVWYMKHKWWAERVEFEKQFSNVRWGLYDKLVSGKKS